MLGAVVLEQLPPSARGHSRPRAPTPSREMRGAPRRAPRTRGPSASRGTPWSSARRRRRTARRAPWANPRPASRSRCGCARGSASAARSRHGTSAAHALHRREVVDIGDRHDVPAVREETRRDVLGERDRRCDPRSSPGWSRRSSTGARVAGGRRARPPPTRLPPSCSRRRRARRRRSRTARSPGGCSGGEPAARRAPSRPSSRRPGRAVRWSPPPRSSSDTPGARDSATRAGGRIRCPPSSPPGRARPRSARRPRAPPRGAAATTAASTHAPRRARSGHGWATPDRSGRSAARWFHSV